MTFDDWARARLAVLVRFAIALTGDRGTAEDVVGAVDVDLSADGLGDSDQLVGRPYAWDPHGTGHYLTMPKGQTVGVATQARGDWAVGRATHLTSGAKPIRTGVAVRWSLRAGDLSTVDNWTENNFLAVNAHGDVASEGDHGATLVRDGKSFTLPTPPTKHEGLAVVFPEAIGDCQARHPCSALGRTPIA